MILAAVTLVAAFAFALGWLTSRGAQRRKLRLQADLLAFGAHELGAPVSAMNITVLNFLTGVFGPVSKEHMPWLILIKEQTARLGHLVGDFRDLVHVEFRKDLRLQREDLDLSHLVSQCIDSMKDSLARLEIAVEKRLPPGPLRVKGDPDRLLRVLISFFTHARKFRTGGPIRVEGRSHAGQALLSVLFSGPKLSAEQLSSAVDLFHPVRDPASQVTACAGFGLGLARRIIASHGGDVTLQEEGGNNTITLRIPLA